MDLLEHVREGIEKRAQVEFFIHPDARPWAPSPAELEAISKATGGDYTVNLFPRSMVVEVWEADHPDRDYPYTDEYKFRAYQNGREAFIFVDDTETKDSVRWLIMHELTHMGLRTLPELWYEYQLKTPEDYDKTDEAHEADPEEMLANQVAREYVGVNYPRTWWRERVERKLAGEDLTKESAVPLRRIARPGERVATKVVHTAWSPTTSAVQGPSRDERGATRQKIRQFKSKLAEKKEYAPGIAQKGKVTPLPKVDKPRPFHFVVQDHHAQRAGRHFDLRLGDPRSGIAHSWALPKAHMPEPGEKPVLAVQVDDHSIPYMSFTGRIGKGYGSGEVLRHMKDKAEVYHSDPGKVKFNIYRGQGPEEYALRRVGKKNWILQNLTKHRGSTDVPSSKPKYREKNPMELDPTDDSKAWQPKIDGAHVTVDLQAGKVPRVYSYRPTERKTGLIEHTHKVPGMVDNKVPAELGDTVVRGELFASGPDHKALPAEQIGGMLNSSVWKSRDLQKQRGRLLTRIFDVVKFKGKDVQDAPYEQKLQMLRQVQGHLPLLDVPETAIGMKAKQRLRESIQKGRYPDTKEGLVEWDLKKGDRPTKAKFRPDYDVYVRRIFPATSKSGEELDRAGGFEYSHTPDGPIAGRVGTGFDHATLRDMKSNPDRFVGRAAKVLALDKHQSGALRAPSFSEWHLDKGKQTSDDMLKQAEVELEQMWGAL